MASNSHARSSRPVPFAKTMALETVDKSTFKSIGPAFTPLGRVYGGHLLAQSAYAASKTVEKGFYCHSIHGTFLILGAHQRQFIYHVEALRTGKSYTTRNVKVTQTNPDGSSTDVIFFATVSFKTRERERYLEHTLPSPRLKEFLENPTQYIPAPDVDIPSWIDHAAQKRIPVDYIGVDIRHVFMEEANRSKLKHEARKIQVYKPIGPFPEDEKINLNICAHIYTSDRNGLFAITSAYDLSDSIIQAGSLSHYMIFHSDPILLLPTEISGSKSRPKPSTSITTIASRREVEEEREYNEDDNSNWFVIEGFSDRASDGRVLMRTRTWNQDGVLLASVMQDAMVRLKFGDSKTDKRTTIGESLKHML